MQMIPDQGGKGVLYIARLESIGVLLEFSTRQMSGQIIL